jgi:hypothetical protein
MSTHRQWRRTARGLIWDLRAKWQAIRIKIAFHTSESHSKPIKLPKSSRKRPCKISRSFNKTISICIWTRRQNASSKKHTGTTSKGARTSLTIR